MTMRQPQEESNPPGTVEQKVRRYLFHLYHSRAYRLDLDFLPPDSILYEKTKQIRKTLFG